MAEEGVIKWMWGAAGLLLWYASSQDVSRSTSADELAGAAPTSSIPVFFPLPGVVKDLGSRTEGFVTNRRLLLSASDAMGRVMYSYKELAELAGYTARVDDLISTIEDVKDGRFQKKLVSSASVEENAKGA